MTQIHVNLIVESVFVHVYEVSVCVLVSCAAAKGIVHIVMSTADPSPQVEQINRCVYSTWLSHAHYHYIFNGTTVATKKLVFIFDQFNRTLKLHQLELSITRTIFEYISIDLSKLFSCSVLRRTMRWSPIVLSPRSNDK